MIFVDYKNKLKYLIIQTEFDYYLLTLLDKENGINIRQNIKEGISPMRLNFKNNSIITVQNYNNDDVVCNLCYTTTSIIFEIYFPFELNKPIFLVDFKYFGNRLDLLRYQVINAYLYEKLLIVVVRTEDVSKYYENIFSDSLGKSEPSIKIGSNKQTSSPECSYKILVVNLLVTNICYSIFPNELNIQDKIWCNKKFNLLDSPILEEIELPYDKILKFSYSESLIKFSKELEKSTNLEDFSSKNPESEMMLRKYKDKIKFFSNIKTTSKVEKNDKDRGILYILTENTLNCFNFRLDLFKYDRRLKYFKHQINIKNLMNYDFVRRLELYNFCLGERIFESIEEIVKEIEKDDFNKSLIMKLLWSNSKQETGKFYEIIENTCDLKYYNNNLSYSKELVCILIDYFSINLINKFSIDIENFLILSYMHLIKLTGENIKSKAIHNYMKMNHKFLSRVKSYKHLEKKINKEFLEENIDQLKLKKINSNVPEMSTNFNASSKLNKDNLKSKLSQEKLDISSLENLDISSSYENKEKSFNVFTKSFSNKQHSVISKSIFANLNILKDQRLDENVIVLESSNRWVSLPPPNYEIFFKIFLPFLFSKKLKNFLDKNNSINNEKEYNYDIENFYKDDLKNFYSLNLTKSSIDDFILNKLKSCIFVIERNEINDPSLNSDNPSIDNLLNKIKILIFCWIVDISNLNERLVEEILILKLKILNLRELNEILIFLIKLFKHEDFNLNQKIRGIRINLDALIDIITINYYKVKDDSYAMSNFDFLSIEDIFKFYSQNLKTFLNYFYTNVSVFPYNIKYSLIAKIFEVSFFFYFFEFKKIFSESVNPAKITPYQESVEIFFKSTGRLLSNKNSIFADYINKLKMEHSHAEKINLLKILKEIKLRNNDDKLKIKEEFLVEFKQTLSNTITDSSNVKKLILKQISL